MAFCQNCGAEIIEGAKFCQECGAPISRQAEQYVEKRQQEYSGKIYKCPNCGEVLKSFEAVCPACGYELRGAKVTSSVQELAKQIADIEAQRPKSRAKSYREIFLEDSSTPDETDSRIASAIQNFPVPNTKEDVLEFLILASANIDTDAIDKSDSSTYNMVSAAWAAKYEQVYQKAKIVCKDDPDFQKIGRNYLNRKKEITRARNQSARNGTISLIVMVGLVAVLFGIMWIVSGMTNAQEDGRLNSIVEQIQTDFDNGEYKVALMNALSIEYGGYDKEQARKWTIQRTYWIEKILDEAAKNGVDLEYMIPKEPEETEPPQESEIPEDTDDGGLFDGIIQGIQDVFKSDGK